jgi:hypothetical protein
MNRVEAGTLVEEVVAVTRIFLARHQGERR